MAKMPLSIVIGKGLKIPKHHARSFPYDDYYTMYNPDPAKIKEQFGSEITAYHLEKFCHVNPLKYIYYDNALWVNLKGNAPCFAYTKYYPEETIAKIKTIDYPMLLTIFSDAQDAGFVTDEFLDSILDRRDQVLAHYNQLNLLWEQKIKILYLGLKSLYSQNIKAICFYRRNNEN